MSSRVDGHPLARPSAWRLWWSFTWRQAAAMLAATIVFSIVLSALKWLGVPLWLTYGSVPYATFAIFIWSGYEAFRLLLSAYDIRLNGAHHDEQNHRHRR
jgi:hypothetical protein